ncbi:cytochrome c family protein [Roseomonas sp. JC162]|uniref:Cytochrome c family protein n=1 Tax=Neoroseomonas marina TaxID=1232220 RepID=A0A848EBK4_9PROT|nr:cytochrome c family protein [Neoroseomonas marina]NMJ40655.1 cytochrome c family protein [Neoroseomonas marina]
MRNVTSALLATVLLAAAPAIAQAQSTGDAEAGRRVFNQCRACHIIDNNGRNAVGPNLFGVVGRRAASIESFRYSANMRELGASGHVWTVDNLRAYITNPKAVVPQGIMSFPGLRNETQLNDLLAFLQTQH